MSIAKVYSMNEARQKQEDPLNLRSLPLASPPADGWPVVAAALRSDARRRNWRRYAGGALAVAATIVLALGLYPRQSADRAAGSAGELAAGPPATAAAGATRTAPATLDSLIALSQQLETRLRAARVAGGRLPASAVVYQVELEDLVIQVDEELSRHPDSHALWNQRVNLLMDLEQLYEDRLRREYHRMASL